jgi:hypothetical protein
MTRSWGGSLRALMDRERAELLRLSRPRGAPVGQDYST